MSTVPYNHFSTLATIEDLFGLAKPGPGPDGHRARSVTDVFTNPGG